MMTPVKKLIEIAKGEIGTVEEGDNLTKYGAAYGVNGVRWCMIFLWWLFREAGLGPLFYGGGKTASCGELLRWAKREGLTVPVDAVKPADIVILNFSGRKVDGQLDTEHCGLVTTILGTGSIETVEGNTTTGAGSQSNGDVVAKKTRYAHQVVGVIRPKYETMDYVGHWAEDTFRWGVGKGLVKGYEDGSFQPDRTITRAEAVTILRRFYNMIGDDGK